MSKFRWWMIGLTALVFVLGCGGQPHDSPGGEPVKPDPTKAVAQVAALYGVKPDGQLLQLDQGLRGVPDSATLQAFLNRADFTQRWQQYLMKLGVDQHHLRDHRVVTVNGQPLSTKCLDRNIIDGNKVASVTIKSDPFWCPLDGGFGKYYLSNSRVSQRWAKALPSYGTAQVEEALFVWLAARWGETYMIEVHNHALSLWDGLPDFPDIEAMKGDHWVIGQIFGYCLAGAFAYAAGLDRGTVVGSLTVLFGGGVDGSGTPDSVYREAIDHGFTQATPGACVRRYWPKK